MPIGGSDRSGLPVGPPDAPANPSTPQHAAPLYYATAISWTTAATGAITLPSPATSLLVINLSGSLLGISLRGAQLVASDYSSNFDLAGEERCDFVVPAGYIYNAFVGTMENVVPWRFDFPATDRITWVADSNPMTPTSGSPMAARLIFTAGAA